MYFKDFEGFDDFLKDRKEFWRALHMSMNFENSFKEC